MTALPANPFGAPGRWFRGCLHCHTTNSDGELAPADLAAHYRQGGFDFIAVTDHWFLTDARAQSDRDFLVLRGIEYATSRDFSSVGTVVHVVGIDPETAIPKRDDLTAQYLIDHIRAHGGEAIVAHPYWSGMTVNDLATLHGYLALEVFNGHVELSRSRGRSTVHWDDLLTRGLAPLGIAVDDSHFPRFDSLKAWTMVRATSLSRTAIMAALRAGHFYASTGPEIVDLRLERQPDVAGGEGSIIVRCSPARSVSVVANGPRGGRVNAGPAGYALRGRVLEETAIARRDPAGSGELPAITAAQFTLTGTERYARIEVEDYDGAVAWSNPLTLET